jgi:hypothetical protein
MSVMVSQAIEIANRMEFMSDTEIEYLWDFLRRRHAETLLGVIDLKLEESKGTVSLSKVEVSARLAKVGIS